MDEKEVQLSLKQRRSTDHWWSQKSRVTSVSPPHVRFHKRQLTLKLHRFELCGATELGGWVSMEKNVHRSRLSSSDPLFRGQLSVLIWEDLRVMLIRKKGYRTVCLEWSTLGTQNKEEK